MHHIFNFYTNTFLDNAYKVKFLWLALLVVFLSCNKFEYSPYNANADENETGNTEKNAIKINNLNLGNSYSFAVISDTHHSYNELNDFINHINSQSEISFVIITGDITHNGSINDYELLQSCLSKLTKPVLTVIGNHDYFLNGRIIYSQVFGDLDYTVGINKVKYIFFDSNIGASPDNLNLDWLESEIRDTTVYNKYFVFSHIAPYSFINESDSSSKNRFITLISQPQLIYSFFGHEHCWNNYADMKLAHVDCIAHRNYTRVDFENSTVNVEQIFY